MKLIKQETGEILLEVVFGDKHSSSQDILCDKCKCVCSVMKGKAYKCPYCGKIQELNK